MILDTSDLSSIKLFAKQILQEQKLIFWCAMLGFTQKKEDRVDGLELCYKSFRTFCFNWINSLLKNGRVVFVSSLAHKILRQCGFQKLTIQ